MQTYHIVMIILAVISIGSLLGYWVFKGKKYTVCAVERTEYNTKLTVLDFQSIQIRCAGWFGTSKLWGTLHYILTANATVASVITVYIASIDNFIQRDIILYSILAMVLTMISLILRCDVKSAVDRNAFNEMQATIYDFKLGKCTEEDLVKCFINCESKITEFYFH